MPLSNIIELHYMIFRECVQNHVKESFSLVYWVKHSKLDHYATTNLLEGLLNYNRTSNYKVCSNKLRLLLTCTSNFCWFDWKFFSRILASLLTSIMDTHNNLLYQDVFQANSLRWLFRVTIFWNSNLEIWDPHQLFEHFWIFMYSLKFDLPPFLILVKQVLESKP